jgi:hypothetical protein
VTACDQLAGLYIAFKCNGIYTNRTDLIDEPGVNKAMNKRKKKGILSFATWNVPYQLEEPCKKNGESENSKAANNICT